MSVMSEEFALCFRFKDYLGNIMKRMATHGNKYSENYFIGVPKNSHVICYNQVINY